MRLSLLDRSRTRAGHPDGAALQHGVERASAAEQFQMLAGLYGDRIDLGVGRTLGFTPPVRQALRRPEAEPDDFLDDVAELRGYLERTAPVTARPVVETPVPLFVLATGRGIVGAAALGLPVVLGGPVLDSPELPEVLAGYRRDFRPHRGSEPSVTVSLDVLVADKDAEARDLALPEVWAMVRSRRTGSFDPLQPVPQIRERLTGDRDADRVQAGLDRVAAGSPATVRRRLEELAERTGADELLASGSTYDRDALAASDAALAALLR